MKKISFITSTIIFATNHGKASAAIEPFERILKATVSELPIESDLMGTFTGEVARPGTMIDALRGKIALARDRTSERFLLASEGSFGASDFGFFAQGIEMLLLHDTITGIEILEQSISLDTNYVTAPLRSREELSRFLDRIAFGSHAAILYPDGLPLVGNVRKGITDRAEAERIFQEAIAESPLRSVIAMSDMRAHLNPTRMRSIATCCELLAQRLATVCPTCSCGGFGLVKTVPGLPCARCGSPTRLARREKHSCPFCGTTQDKPRADERTCADPSTCDRCNP